MAQATLRLKFLTADKKPVRDPAMRIEVCAVKNNQLVGALREGPVPPSPTFTVPAIPHPHQHLYVRVRPTRFHDTNLEPFVVAGDETKRFHLFRRPNEWTPRFDDWADLPVSFTPYKNVLEASHDILVVGLRGVQLNTFAGASYDGIDRSKDKLVFAKAALLNLRAKLTELHDPLTDDTPWFSYIRRLIKIGRERFIAEVDPVMADHVRHIRREIGRFEDYKRTPAKNHHRNFPKSLDVKKGNLLFSIKSHEDRANLQLTLGRGTDPDTGNNVWLLDTDIDEHGDLAGHIGDLIKHKFSGGTHPYDVHDLLHFLSTRDLGYRLLARP